MILKVKQNKNPYHIIGEYIEKHTTCVDDIIAVISLDGNIINELFLAEITTESNFIWQNDWWEGEENVELIDFFFVRDACKKYNDNNLINRQAAIDAAIEATDDWDGGCNIGRQKRIENYINKLPSAQPDIVRCKGCKYAEYIDDVQTLWCTECGQGRTVAPDDFCSYGERREVTT